MLKFHFIIIVFLGYFSKTVSGVTKTYSLNSESHSVNDTSPLDTLITESVPEIVHTLFTLAPEHVLYLLYDDIFEGISADAFLKVWRTTGKGITVIRLLADMNDLLIAISTPLTDVSIGRRHVLVICSLSNIIQVFQLVSERSLESPTLWWILIVIEEEAPKFLQEILREGSQVIVVQMVDPGSFKLLSSAVDKNGSIWFREAGSTIKHSEVSNGFLVSDVFEDLEKTYSNFKGRRLSVAANDNNPFIVLKVESNGEIAAEAGFEYEIVDSLSEALNFTYRMITPEDGKWGGPLPNGTVVGMIGEVAYRRAHFAICEITITRVREEVIDFSYPHYIESLTLISRTPRERNRTFAAFSPFTPLVWLCIAATLVMIGPFLTFESWIMKKYRPGHHVYDSTQDFILNLLASFLKQVNLIESHYWPHKVIFLFWYIFCLIVTALYSGMLTATLISPSFEKPINSLTDLPMAIKDGFTLVVTDDTSDEYMFKNAKRIAGIGKGYFNLLQNAKEGIYAETWKLFNHKDRSKSFVPHPSYAMEGILEDKLVLINGILGARYLSMRKGIRRYYFARDSFASQYYGIALFSGAPFIQSFNKMLFYMVEGGLITKWVDKEFQKVAGNNNVIETSGPRAYTVKHLQAAFYILAIGYVLGALLLGIEKLSVCF